MTTECLPCEQQRLARGDLPGGEAPDIDPGKTAKWSGPIGIENQRTGDGRRIKTNALRWDTLPVPLRWAMQDFGAHDGAYVVGKIETIDRIDYDEANRRLEENGRDPLPESFADAVIIWGSGVHDLGSEYGREAHRQVDEGLTPGISMDLDDIVVEEDGEQDEFSILEGRVRAATQVAIPAFEGARISVSRAGREVFDADERLADAEALMGDEEAFNWVDDVGGLPTYIKRIEKHLQKKGMTESNAIATAVNVVKKMCATGDLNFPGAQQVNAGSRAEACAAVAEWEEKKARAKASSAETLPPNGRTQVGTAEHYLRVPEGDALVAGAAAFPHEWFQDPKFSEPTGLTVTEDGRVFGHIALWGTCHIGSPQGKHVCTQPPRSYSNYAYFKTGAVQTTAGEIPVGKITMNTLHAGPRLASTDTIYHYEHTGSVGAYVTAGEDAHGIWVAGAAKPGADLTALKAAPVSGDWRTIGGNLELVGALSVNVPGFPVPRAQALVAGGAVQSLVASGVFEAEEKAAVAATLDLDDERVVLALRERFREMDRREKAEALAARVARLAALEKVRRVRATLPPAPRMRRALRARTRRTGYNSRMETFGYNADQWRMPRGNPKGGQWIDMPDTLISGLKDMFETEPVPDPAVQQVIDGYLDNALSNAERAREMLGQGPSQEQEVKNSARAAHEALLSVRTNTDEVTQDDPETRAMYREWIDSVREPVKDLMNADLSLLDADSDIGGGDAGGAFDPDADEDSERENVWGGFESAYHKNADPDIDPSPDELREEYDSYIDDSGLTPDEAVQAIIKRLNKQREGSAGKASAKSVAFRARARKVTNRHAAMRARLRAGRASFGYNPDQWRVPKGNGKYSGRFVDMPHKALADLESNLIAKIDSGEIPEDKAEGLGDLLAEASNHADRASDALTAGDGDAAKQAAADAVRVLDELKALAASDGVSEAVDPDVDVAREVNQQVADSDLSLLGDEGIGGDAPGSDIGGEDKAVVGDAPAEEAPSVKPGGGLNPNSGYDDIDPLALTDALSESNLDDATVEATVRRVVETGWINNPEDEDQAEVDAMLDTHWDVLRALPEGTEIRTGQDPLHVDWVKDESAEGGWRITEVGPGLGPEDGYEVGGVMSEPADIDGGGDNEIYIKDSGATPAPIPEKATEPGKPLRVNPDMKVGDEVEADNGGTKGKIVGETDEAKIQIEDADGNVTEHDWGDVRPRGVADARRQKLLDIAKQDKAPWDISQAEWDGMSQEERDEVARIQWEAGGKYISPADVVKQAKENVGGGGGSDFEAAGFIPTGKDGTFGGPQFEDPRTGAIIQKTEDGDGWDIIDEEGALVTDEPLPDAAAVSEWLAEAPDREPSEDSSGKTPVQKMLGKEIIDAINSGSASPEILAEAKARDIQVLPTEDNPNTNMTADEVRALNEKRVANGAKPLPVPGEDATDTPQGTPQQQAAAKAADTSSRLETALTDVADTGALDDADAEAVGVALEDFREAMERLSAGVQDGNYDSRDLSVAQARLQDLEAQMMAAADKPGMDDEQANSLGVVLDDMFNDLGELASTLQGSSEPPPFAARRYVRQWLGRRGIRLGSFSRI